MMEEERALAHAVEDSLSHQASPDRPRNQCPEDDAIIQALEVC